MKSRIATFATVGIILVCIVTQSGKATENEYYYQNYIWYYRGERWTWSLSIPKTLYDSYKSVPVSTRVRDGPSGYGFLTTTNDRYLNQVVNKLRDAAYGEGYGLFDQVSYVLAFVQSLPYTSDLVTTGYDEYPRFPVETLLDGGDCEDTSILFASIVLNMRYDTILINPPGHMAVGVWATENLRGTHYTWNGRNYYYCETTGDGWKIGDVPSEFQNVDVTLYSINQKSQFDPNQATYTPAIFIVGFGCTLLVLGLISAHAIKPKRKNPAEASESHD